MEVDLERFCDIITFGVGAGDRHFAEIPDERSSVGGMFKLSTLRSLCSRAIIKAVVHLELLDEVPQMLRS